MVNSIDDDIVYVDYTDESMLQEIQTLVAKDLSEPYSVFTYRYFLHNWPSLCVCAYAKAGEKEEKGEMIAVIVCKADVERDCMRGYMAMLAVSKTHRNRGIGLKVLQFQCYLFLKSVCNYPAIRCLTHLRLYCT